MSKTVWFDNPWIYVEKVINRIKTFFKQTEPEEVIWLDNPWVYLDTATKKIHKYFTED